MICKPHAEQSRDRRSPAPLEQFLADPRLRPLPPLPECAVQACTRPTELRLLQYPLPAVEETRRATPARTRSHGEPPNRGRPTGLVGLRALPALVAVEVLAGLQTRPSGRAQDRCLTEDGRHTLRRQKAAAIDECDADWFRKRSRSVLRALARDARRAVADPGTEQDRDTWDLAVFGHRGGLDFTGITQPWLSAAAKRWAADHLPRHRGTGATRVQAKLSNAAPAVGHLNGRPDRGDPAALSRGDVEAFLNRVAYLETAGQISRYQRNMICRERAAVLAAVRDLSLARAGLAAGLAGDVAIGRADIPAVPQRGEPGRDLPPEIMTVLCAGLDDLPPGEIKIATQIAIDTGRRPEEILGLPLDCLTRDKDGAAVLIPTTSKLTGSAAGSRSAPTAEVITSQQQRVRQRFPHAPAAKLRLLPTSYRNPDGTKPISRSTLEARHRNWVGALQALRTRDGLAFDTAKIVPYAYRHSYAQRHADAGVPIDVLAELLDHRSYSVTRSGTVISTV